MSLRCPTLQIDWLNMKIQSISDSIKDKKAEIANHPGIDIVLCGRKRERTDFNPNKAETDLSILIFQTGNGLALVKFCRELSGVIIGQYSMETDVVIIRTRVRRSLVANLRCSELQADSLFALSLELIHARLHGHYRRSNLEIGYLIAMASGAVADISAN